MNTNHRVIQLGPDPSNARGVLILLHGRGSSAEDIVRLAKVLEAEEYAILAPDSEHGAWYPQRFLAPTAANEPYLTEALAAVKAQVAVATGAGVPLQKIGLIGFSQGACLALEFVARNPGRYGFVAGLSGALIGPLNTPRPIHDLKSTPILLGCAEQDAHIPLEHVNESELLLKRMNAEVTRQIHPGAAHTVFPAEVDWINQRLK